MLEWVLGESLILSTSGYSEYDRSSQESTLQWYYQPVAIVNMIDLVKSQFCSDNTSINMQ